MPGPSLRSAGGRVPPGRTIVSAGMSVAVLDRDQALGLLPEWRALHGETGSWSPFADPDLQVTWCRLFVPVGAERIIAVRRMLKSGQAGPLVAVLPMYVVSGGLSGRVIRHLRPFGGHHEALINEMPEMTLDPQHARASLAAVIAWLGQTEGWDFVEFSMRGDQPWVEARWLVDAGLDSAIVMHKKAYPSIVLDLPAAGGELVLKRNLRESLRRSRNRMKRAGGEWVTQRSCAQDANWAQALDDLVRLHGARATMDSSAPKHADVFANTSQRAYLQQVADAGRSSTAVIHRLLHDGAPVAALLVFEYPDMTWISLSGAEPAAWDLGAVTALQGEAVQSAHASGRRSVVFSVGIDTAKLRWSETVRVRNSFIVTHARRRSRWAFRAYWLVWAFARSLVDVSPYTSSSNQNRPGRPVEGAAPDRP